jgi:hypothetical protein
VPEKTLYGHVAPLHAVIASWKAPALRSGMHSSKFVVVLLCSSATSRSFVLQLAQQLVAVRVLVAVSEVDRCCTGSTVLQAASDDRQQWLARTVLAGCQWQLPFGSHTW